MKIVMLTSILPTNSKGGVGYQIVRLADALMARGHKVTIYSFADGDPGWTFQLQGPTRGGSWFSSKVGRHVLVPFAFASRSWSEFDLIHAHGDSHLLLWHRRPIVRTFYGSAREESRHAGTLARRLSQAAFFSCDLLARRAATVTVGISKNTERSMGSLDALIPCGVDLSLFRPGNKSPSPSILFIGTMGGRKRGRLLLEVFREYVLPRVPECQLWLVVDERIDGSSIRSWSRPSDAEVAKLCRRAWALVHPSQYEAFGVPYLEALASGTPVISSSNPGAEELLRDDHLGMIVADEYLGPAIVELLGDPRRREEMAQHGRRSAGRFGWDEVAKRYEDVYELACARGVPAMEGGDQRYRK